MILSFSPNESQIQTVLRSFLLSVVPMGVECVAGQSNRVAEPQGADFIVFTPIMRARLSTNLDTYADCSFTGSITNNILNVTSINFGKINIGNELFGIEVTQGTLIISGITGSGGIGTYYTSISQEIESQKLASGQQSKLQPVKITFQIDVHGPNSADNAFKIQTMWRDMYGPWQFRQSGLPIRPLYCDDPRQVAFIDAENQYEDRYSIDAHLEADQTIVVSQQFADQIHVSTINVDAAYQGNPSDFFFISAFGL